MHIDRPSVVDDGDSIFGLKGVVWHKMDQKLCLPAIFNSIESLTFFETVPSCNMCNIRPFLKIAYTLIGQLDFCKEVLLVADFSSIRCLSICTHYK